MVVEGGTDGDNRHTNSATVLIGKDLLAWTSEPHEHDPCSRRTDPIHDLGLLPRAGATELRGFRTGDVKIRETSLQSRPETIKDGGRASVQVDGKVFRGSRPTEPQHEARTIDTVFQLGPVEEIHAPANRLAVRCHDVQMVEAVSVFPVEDPGHDPMDGESRDGQRSTLTSSLHRLPDHILIVDRIYEHPEEVPLCDRSHPNHRSRFDS
jgi:hypothetical protein